MRYYLNQFDSNQAEGAIALASIGCRIVDCLWQQTYRELIDLKQAGNPLAAAWRSSAPDSNPYLRGELFETEDEELRQYVYASFDRARWGNKEDLQLLDQLAPAVVVTLLEDLSDERDEIRNHALAILLKIEPDLDVTNALPILRFHFARTTATASWTSDPELVELVVDSAERLRSLIERMGLEFGGNNNL